MNSELPPLAQFLAKGDEAPVTVIVVISVAQRTYGAEDARVMVAEAALVYSAARVAR
jgi:hypothetical protein